MMLETVVIVVHLLAALGLVVLVLLQQGKGEKIKKAKRKEV